MSISCILFTSTHPRHDYVAHSVAQAFNLKGIVREAKPTRKANLLPVVKEHLAERAVSEDFYFGGYPKLLEDLKVPIFEIPSGTINSQEVSRWLDEHNPDFILLFGSGIVGEDILKKFDGRVVNMHLGLSPYYRGTATNFWPIVYKEPECLGATVHLAVLKVDAGAILSQVRPTLSSDDSCHDIGCKTIIAGTKCLIDSLEAYSKKEISPKKQEIGEGKVFKSSDMSEEAIKIALENLRGGLLADYILEKERRDAARPIIVQV